MVNPLKTWIISPTTKKATGTDRVLSRTESARLLTREKARTDRTHLPFSVLRLTGDFRTANGQERFKRLADICRATLRITDDLGWLSEHEMAVILPATGAAGAECVADRFEDRFQGEFGVEVFTYPSNWWMESMTAEQREAVTPPSLVGASLTDRPIETNLLQPMPWWKRTMDVVCSGMGLVCLSPLFLLIALLIKTTSHGPIFFSQRRTGLGGRVFTILKFRSMVADADARKHLLSTLNEQDGPAFKIKNDPRITSIGRFLRKTSLDELPQLWNVFRGDMSLVGPRPLPCNETAGCQPWHLTRLQVVPGLTCIWQVQGRSRVTFDEWMRMDLQYIRSMSFQQDVKLIVQTAWGMAVKKNGM